jgi:scyllo-inosamine 4-kinase
LYDEVVIRIALRPGPGTLRVESLIASRLPAAVGYPTVIDSGVIDGHDWMAQQRLPGDNLAALWDSLDQDQRGFAVTDLVTRLDAVTRADLSGLSLPGTPLYAFDPGRLRRQLAVVELIIGRRATERARQIAQTGLGATALIGQGLVHTDAVLDNVMWTGSAAIPIDFEFGCAGPVDLDADCVGREVGTRADRQAITALAAALGPTLTRPGALDRLRGYSVLRHLWAVGKWVDNDPSLTDADTWEPVRSLIADTERRGWVDQLLRAVR